MLNSDDFVFSQDPKTNEITAAGYNINSALMKSNCPALISYTKKKNAMAIPAGLVMIQEAGAKLIQSKTNEVVPNDIYDKLLENVFPHSLTKTKSKSKSKSKTKTKTKSKSKTKSNKNKSRKLKK